jgi:RNA-directed DNA polymerase
MLQALEKGVKGGVWFSLIDKVYSEKNLRAAFKRVRKNHGAPGIDNVTVEHFELDLEHNITKLIEELKAGTYQPQMIKRVYIDKPGKKGEKRPLGIPTVRDRVVQTALRSALEPIFEKEFAAYSYGFRPRRGCKDALRRVERLLNQGYTWVVDADIKSFFDTIPHKPLMAKVMERIADRRVLDLIESYLKQGIMEEMRFWTPEEGTPQGAVLSPLLANIYLNPLDHLMKEHGIEITRYADDFVVQCKTEKEAMDALDVITRWMTPSGLALHPEKTRIVDMTGDRNQFVFLGYEFLRTRRGRLLRLISKKSITKLRANIVEHTPKKKGISTKAIVKELNAIIHGFYNYFKQSHYTCLEKEDGRIRERLRGILRKRTKRKGCARGYDHIRWPNKFFKKLGLFSMATAKAEELQSYRR